MSNTLVGRVYDRVISDVIDAVRVDFEEGGVDDAVLQELKSIWQHKLTRMKVASFPWDPKPASNESQSAAPAAPPPPQALAPVPTANGNYTQTQLSPPSKTMPLPLPGPGSSNVHVVMKREGEPIVKQEGKSEFATPMNQLPARPQPQFMPTDMARQRAIDTMNARYGLAASGSIQALQARGPPAAQVQAQAQQSQRPPHPQQSINAQMQQQLQYSQTLSANIQQRMAPHPNGQAPLPHSQIDGAVDSSVVDDFVKQRDAGGNSVEIDGLLHAQITARAKEMEGGGLMLPLQEAFKVRRTAKKRQPAAAVLGQYDGNDDDNEENDSINSDLDDPDDPAGDEDEDGEEGHMMLCMYDKVQRVKNKWKCQLKDGVLTINGREYVFSKASGEYEW